MILNVLKNLYLFAFNIVLCFGWLYILHLTFPYLSRDPSYETFELNVRKPLQTVQTIALIEILHILLKLVQLNIFNTINIVSHLFVLWLVFYYKDIYQLSTGDIYTKKIPYGSDFEVGILGCCLSWSCVEVTRYLFNALDIYGLSPYMLTRSRYSLFTILYPTGITSELYCIWKMRQNVNPLCWAIIPSHGYNFAFSYKALVTWSLCFYALFPPFYYKNMIYKRRKILAKLDGHKVD